MDTVLTFGLRSAPKIFNAVANGLEWACQREGVHNSLHYLDDFLLIGSPRSHECANYLSILRSVFHKLGVEIAEHKTVGPSSSVIFLGIEIDADNQVLRLPVEKLSELRALIAAWLDKKVTVARDLKSLVGKLEHACRVVHPGWSFLRRMLDLLKGVNSNHCLVHLSAAFRSDLMWWHVFLTSWNGVSAIPLQNNKTTHVVVYSDAAGSLGCAAWWDKGWIHYNWPTALTHTPITPKETLPMVLACTVWGRMWKD